MKKDIQIARKELLELCNLLKKKTNSDNVRVNLEYQFPNGVVKSINVFKGTDESSVFISRVYEGEIPPISNEEVLEYARIIKEKLDRNGACNT